MKKLCWWSHQWKLWYHDLYFKNTFILRKSKVVNFAEIIKIATMFIKKTFKDSKEVKRISNSSLKCNLYLYFLIWQKLPISREKNCWCQLNSIGVSHGLCVFLIFFRESITVLSFINVGYRKRRSFWTPPHLWASPKSSILNQVEKSIF